MIPSVDQMAPTPAEHNKKKSKYTSEILDFHSSGAEDSSLIKCDNVVLDR
jgi:hypothetical protein